MVKTWGAWENVELVKECGQSHVFKVRHADSGILAALKRLKNIGRIQRFEKEVDAAKELHHPHIAALVDFDLNGKEPYAVYEWVDGGSIGDLTEEELAAISTEDKLVWSEQICEALAFAHGKGMVHRDIKPDNILLVESRLSAKLCDFGLVFVDQGERYTATEEQVGSRFYIAPECEDGRTDEIGPATDMYSLGKVIYYLFSNGRIFARGTDSLSLIWRR